MPSWNDYYRRLNVCEYSTTEGIKAAYESLSLTCHPDKHEELSKLKEAYRFLLKRAEYTRLIAPPKLDNDSYIREFEEQKLFYEMVDDPNKLDHYSFFNKFFNLPKNEELIPGDPISNTDHLWEKLTYVGHKIMRELEALNRVLEEQFPRRNNKIRKRIKELKKNEFKLGLVETIFLSSENKSLYDLSLGIIQSKELEEIKNLIGGNQAVKDLIQSDPRLYCARAIFWLKKSTDFKSC